MIVTPFLQIIQKGCVMTTQNRPMRIYISSQFIYEIFEDIPFQFDVNNRVIVQNLQNEEMLEIKWKEYIWWGIFRKKNYNNYLK